MALLRIQNLLLVKLFIIFKESDSDRQYIRRLGLAGHVEDIEQEVENSRNELSERIKLYRLLANKDEPF